MGGDTVQRWAAFLRGINLGRRRVTGADLAAPFVDLGFQEVATFLASGNVVFSADGRAAEAVLVERIERQLLDDLGFPVTTFLRTEGEVAAIAAAEPFAASDVAATEGRVQVMLLQDVPSSADRDQVLALATDEDRLHLDGRELYWLPQRGISTSPLDVTAIERTLGTTTTRTLNTLTRLHARFFA